MIVLARKTCYWTMNTTVGPPFASVRKTLKGVGSGMRCAIPYSARTMKAASKITKAQIRRRKTRLETWSNMLYCVFF
jgi:hypothetical protein